MDEQQMAEAHTPVRHTGSLRLLNRPFTRDWLVWITLTIWVSLLAVSMLGALSVFEWRELAQDVGLRQPNPVLFLMASWVSATVSAATIGSVLMGVRLLIRYIRQ